MRLRDILIPWTTFLIGTVLGTLSCIGAMEEVHAADSLEVVIAVPTPKGPQLTVDSGCHVYSLFVGAIAWEYMHGVSFNVQKQRMATEVLPRETVPGMTAFLVSEIAVIYATPRSIYADLKYEKDVTGSAVDAARNFCREQKGRTWEMRRSPV